MKKKSIISTLALLLPVIASAEGECIFHADDITLVKGSVKDTIELFLNNAVSVCGFQFDIYLPEGVNVTTGRTSTAYKITKDAVRFQGTDHGLSFKQQTDGSLRVMCVSNTNASICDKDGSGNDIRQNNQLLSVPLTIDDGLSGGAHDIYLRNIILSSYTAGNTVKYTESDVSFAIVVRPTAGSETSESSSVLSVATAPGTEISASDYKNITNGKTDAVIDLRAAELSSDITAAKIQEAGAALYYLPSGSGISGENIIVDKHCESCVLTDGTDCVIPSAFTATSVSYQRDMTASAWGTIFLPYDVESDATIQYYQLSATSMSSGTMTFEPVAKVSAGTPAVFRVKNGTEANVTSANAEIEVGSRNWSNTVSGSTWTMNGTYAAKTVNPADSEFSGSDIYYIAENKFWYADQSFPVGAFRAWFETPKSSQNSNMYRIEDGTTNVEISEQDNGNVEVRFDLSGRELSEPVHGINIINGKKVLTK